MLSYTDTRNLTRHDLVVFLDDIRALLDERNRELACGGEFTEKDEFTEEERVNIVLDHAEEVLGDPAVNALVCRIARFGRRAKITIHLIFDRPLGTLTLGDFGSGILRAMAADENTDTITITDRDGVTLSTLREVPRAA
jgi:hypothetical protein